MANQGASLVAGKLTAEEAERLAASFRPAWELDDAPFQEGSALSAADMAALEGGGVNSDVRRATPQVGTAPPRAHVDSSPDSSIIVDVDMPSAPEAPPTPRMMMPAPQPEARPRQAPPPHHQALPGSLPITERRPPPPRVAQAADSGEYVPIKKSNKGLFIGIGGVIALIAGVLVIRSVTSEGPKPKAAAVEAATQPTQQGVSIPPPPSMADLATTTQSTATTATATTTAQSAPAPTVPATHVANVAPPVTRPPPGATAALPPNTATTRPPGGVTKPPPKATGGGIVHDVLF